MNRPGVSEEAKRHAREVLEASGYSVEMPEGSTEDEHEVSFGPLIPLAALFRHVVFFQTRVIAGYKAALNSKFSVALSFVVGTRRLTWTASR